MGFMIDGGMFESHSGLQLPFKIDCDSMSEAEWFTIARQVAKKYKFRKVYGVPRGGLKFAEALNNFVDKDSKGILIVDDVLTTGNSMVGYRTKIITHLVPFLDFTPSISGVVLVSRGECPEWISSVFTLNEGYR